ncbi:hypothetical protein O6H91_05G114700 [Diphasiastrum complanatum]|uniref:Uncharacterized protein n=1 Tax=Diphasiastrum complanatum TaxID=34168 RepID=A0ACC2DSA7_DIPCM|nr:hypothetical protein O6H91_05G114700 [Diphasiastrum complanatum]
MAIGPAKDKIEDASLFMAGMLILQKKIGLKEKAPKEAVIPRLSSSPSISSLSVPSSSVPSITTSHSAFYMATIGNSSSNSLETKEADMEVASRYAQEASRVSSSDEENGMPLLEIEDVRLFLRKAGHVWDKIRRFGLPETSWKNKAPWHNPRPDFLAKGLEWPPESFDSEEQRREYYRKARERRPFLVGTPPTWTFMLANVGLLAFLIYNPFGT